MSVVGFSSWGSGRGPCSVVTPSSSTNNKRVWWWWPCRGRNIHIRLIFRRHHMSEVFIFYLYFILKFITCRTHSTATSSGFLVRRLQFGVCTYVGRDGRFEPSWAEWGCSWNWWWSKNHNHGDNVIEFGRLQTDGCRNDASLVCTCCSW